MSKEGKAIRKRAAQVHRKRLNERTKGRENHGKKWTEADIARLWDTRYTTVELAELLDRTYHSISYARIRYAVYAPDDYRHNGCRRVDHSGVEKA